MPTFDDQTARRYLLGDLPEDEAAALEELYFASQDALDQMRGAEEDLLDEYVAGSLPPAERRRFEARLLGSPLQRKRLAAARALRLAGRAVAGGPVRWRPAARLVGTLAAAALVAVGWQRLRPKPAEPPVVSPRASLSPGAGPPATAASLPPAAPEPPGAGATAEFAVALAPVLTRSGGGPGAIHIPAHTTQVRLELRGEAGVLAAGAKPWASVTTVEGEPVFAGPAQLPAAGDRPGLLATLRLPAELLVPNDYVVALSGGAGGEPTARYFLQVAP